MKYLRRFNESMVDYEDFLFSFFDKDPDFIDQGDDWIYLQYDQLIDASDEEKYNIIYDKLKKYFNGQRFTNVVVKSQVDYGDFYVLVVKKEFFNNHIKVEELDWEDHPLIKNLDKVYGSHPFHDAKIVEGLPNNCSLIRGLNYSGSIEFWPQEVEPEPTNVKNNIELQYLLYKYAI